MKKTLLFGLLFSFCLMIKAAIINPYSSMNLYERKDMTSIDLANDISIYPNPASDYINVSIKGKKNCEVILYSQDGAVLRTTESNGAVQFDIRSFEKGTYLVEVVDKATGNGYMKKVVKE